MGASIVFDTHAYVKKLKGVGFTEKQAEVQATAIAKLIDERLTTKQDLKALGTSLTIRLGVVLAASIVIIGALVKIL